MDRRPSRAKTTAAKSHLQKICVLAMHTFLMTNLSVLTLLYHVLKYSQLGSPALVENLILH
jgi:hypothetical protein